MKKCLLLLFAAMLFGCSHSHFVPHVAISRPVAMTVPIPTPAWPETVVPSLSSGPPGALRYWKASSDYVDSLSFSPDGKQLATADAGNEVNVWGVASGRLLRSYHLPNIEVSTVTFSPNGLWLAAVDEKNQQSVIDILDTRTGRLIQSLSTQADGFYTLQFSRDSTRLMAGGPEITVYDTGTWSTLFHLKTDDSIVFTSEGRHFLRCSEKGLIRICDAQTGRTWKSWQEPRSKNDYSYYLQSLSGDGKMLAVEKIGMVNIEDAQESTHFNICSLRLLNAHNGHLIRVMGGEKVNPRVAFSPRGGTIANWDFDGYGPDQLAFWNIRTGQYEQVYDEGVMNVVFSPDGKTVAMGDTSGGVSIFRVPRWR